MTQSRLPDVRRPWLASFTAGGLAPRPPWKEHSAHPQPVLFIHVYFPHLLFLMFWEMFGERNMGRVLGTVSPTVNWGRTSSVIEMTVGTSVQGSSKFLGPFGPDLKWRLLAQFDVSITVGSINDSPDSWQLKSYKQYKKFYFFCWKRAIMSIRGKNLISIASLFYNPIFKSKSGIYNVVNQSHSQLAFPRLSRSAIQPLLESAVHGDTPGVYTGSSLVIQDIWLLLLAPGSIRAA